MSGAQPSIYDARSSATSLTPYLTLPHLLSLTWLAYPILSLIFVAFRLQLSLADAQNAINSTKSDLVASCKAAETAATSAASMPRFLALATNQQYADAVNGTLNGARATLILALTVMESIINFLIDIYRSTFLCFLELIVQSGIAVLIGAVQAVRLSTSIPYSLADLSRSTMFSKLSRRPSDPASSPISLALIASSTLSIRLIRLGPFLKSPFRTSAAFRTSLYLPLSRRR